MIGNAMAPWVLVDVADHVAQTSERPYLCPLQLKLENPSLLSVVAVVAAGIAVEKNRERFVKASFCFRPGSEKQVKVVMKQAVSVGFRDGCDVRFVKLKKKAVSLFILKQRIAIFCPVIYMVVS